MKNPTGSAGHLSSLNASFVRLSASFLLASVALGGLCPWAMQFDQRASSFLRNLDLPGDIQKAISLSEVFAHGLGVAAILLTLLYVAVHRRRVVMIAVLITALSGLTANALKATVVRVRPHAEGLQVIGHNDSHNDSNNAATANNAEAVEQSFWDARQRSFPSGHAATAWGLAIGLSLVFWRGWWIFGMLAVLASLQRIESGAHYPSDVLAGMAIAFFISACILASSRIRVELA